MPSTRAPRRARCQAAALPTPPVQASTYVVNSTADSHDQTPGNGVCADSSGRCTLRAAVEEVNAGGGGDTITVPASVPHYVLSRSAA